MADADEAGSVDPLDVGAFIRSQRERAEMSVRRLAELADVSNPYLSQIERGLRKPSAEILQQIANAMRISVESLYVRAGILDAERDHDLMAAIRSQPDLTGDQKQVLIRIYTSFLAENGLENEAEGA